MFDRWRQFTWAILYIADGLFGVLQRSHFCLIFDPFVELSQSEKQSYKNNTGDSIHRNTTQHVP